MTPIVSNTQIPVPTQVSFVATQLPGTQALRALPDAVAPSVSNAALGNDYKGNGVYVAPLTATPATASPLTTPLSILIPANFSTSSASLSATAMFAAQALSQGAESGAQYFTVYEELVAASQVKYKPSNAALPEPAPGGLFAKMLAESQTQTQNSTRTAVAAQQTAPKEVASQVAAHSAPPPKLAPTTRQKTSEAITATQVRHASNAYHAVSVSNRATLETPEQIEVVAS